MTLELAGLIALAIFGIAFYIAVRVLMHRARREEEGTALNTNNRNQGGE
jgi:hypothetical protein